MPPNDADSNESGHQLLKENHIKEGVIAIGQHTHINVLRQLLLLMLQQYSTCLSQHCDTASWGILQH